MLEFFNPNNQISLQVKNIIIKKNLLTIFITEIYITNLYIIYFSKHISKTNKIIFKKEVFSEKWLYLKVNLLEPVHILKKS